MIQPLVLPCGIFADKCSACRTYAQTFYDQFAVSARPMTDYAELRAILAYPGLCEQRIYINPNTTESRDVPTVAVIHALGRTVLSLACRVEFLENQIKLK